MARPPKNEIGVGILLVVAVGLLAWMSVQVGALRGLGDRTRASAALQDAAGLTEGAEVKVAGVTVGQVVSLTLDHDAAVVTFEVDAEAGLRRDAVAQVRARSVLGEKYLDLLPQSREAPLLEDGDRLSTTLPGTEIDQLVNALGPMLAAAEPEALEAIVSAVHRAVEDDPERLTRMLQNLDRIAVEGAAAAAGLPGAVAESRAVLARLQALMESVEPAVDRLDPLTQDLATVSGDLPQVLGEVEGLVQDSRGAVKTAQVVLDAAAGSADDLQALLANLAEIDKVELRRLLREEGVLIRLRERPVVAEEPDSVP